MKRICSEHTISSMITRRDSITISHAFCAFSLMVVIDRRYALSSYVTLFQPLLSFSINALILLRSRTLSPYCDKSLGLISAPDTPPTNEIGLLLLALPWCPLLSKRLCLHCNRSKKVGAIKFKPRSENQNNTNYNHA